MKKNETAKILNALRMGVIPNTTVGDIMTGRNNEADALVSMLDWIIEEDISGVKFLKGGYGSGKTFMLHYLKEKALEKGFVTVTLSIQNGFNLSRLDSLYTQIMNHLEIKDTAFIGGTDFEEIFEKWLKNIKKRSDATQIISEVINSLSTYHNAFAMVLMTYIRAKISRDDALAQIAVSWIRGDKNVSYDLKKQLNVKGSVDMENAMVIFKGFTHLIKQMGYEGVVILVDEVELIMNNRVDTRQKAYENIRLLMDLCGNNELESTYLVFAGTKELFTDEEKGFPCYGALQQRIGTLMQVPSDLPRYQPIVEVGEFDTHEFLEVTEKVYALHKRQYHYEESMEIGHLHKLVLIECMKIRKSKPSVREYIKKLIEFLDTIKDAPDMPILNTKISNIKVR